MKQLARLTLGLIALLLLTACGVDPRKEAEAFRIKQETFVNNADAEVQRAHEQQMNDLRIRQLAEEQARRDEAHAQRVASAKAMWTTVKIFGSISLAVAMLATAFFYTRTTYGLSLVAIEAAQVRANLIPLDRVTRQFPLLRQVHGSRYVLHNPNTGAVVMLDTSRDEDRQMIAAMGMTQLAGAIAHEARQSSDPAGLAMMNPAMTNAMTDRLIVGNQIIENAIPLVKDTES